MPAMDAHMIAMVAVSSESGVLRRRISLPLIPDLIDNRKYYLPESIAEPRGEELRAQCRPKAAKILAARPARRPHSQKFQAELENLLGLAGLGRRDRAASLTSARRGRAGRGPASIPHRS